MKTTTLSIIFALSCGLLLCGCEPKPEETIQKFYAAAQAKQFDEAQKLMSKKLLEEMRKLDSLKNVLVSSQEFLAGTKQLEVAKEMMAKESPKEAKQFEEAQKVVANAIEKAKNPAPSFLTLIAEQIEKCGGLREVKSELTTVDGLTSGGTVTLAYNGGCPAHSFPIALVYEDGAWKVLR